MANNSIYSRQLSKEASFVDKMLNGLGLSSLSFQQMRCIFKRAFSISPKISQIIFDTLRIKDYLRFDESGKHLLRFGQEIDRDTEDAIWYMIFKIAQNIEPINQRPEDYEQIFYSTFPYNFSFISNGKVYQVCVCKDAKDTKIMAAELNYKNSASSSLNDDIVTVFLFSGTEYEDYILEMIEGKQLTLPHIIAFKAKKIEEITRMEVQESDGAEVETYHPAYFEFDEFINE